MAPKAQTAPKYDEARHAKDLLDMIGKDVYDKVHKKDADYRNVLHGHLKQATYSKIARGQETPKDPCNLEYQYHTNVTDGFGKEYPCKDRPQVRFSKERGAECDDRKIEGNSKDVGACAPYRRLSLCDHHLSYMNADKTNTTDNLLLEVCLAAKYEGDYLKHYSENLNLTYPDSPSQLCTELARSFADIGDIVRGRDLYGSNNRRRDKLEEKLKGVFGKIYGELMKDLKKDDKTKGERNVEKAEKRYNDPKGYFFQLRDDWWDVNRLDVWKAITCDVSGFNYFRKTCSNGLLGTNDNCRCVTDVPTYFDYVPQYLRWFEEWAEDFCRKKKHKLKNAKKQCREGEDENGQPIYCDLKGFDCQRTKYKNGDFVRGNECHKCSVACNPFVEWLDRQKKEFDKQKKKYDEEIQKYENGASRNSNRRRRRDARSSSSGSDDNGYEKLFYEILKLDDVGGLGKFLEKLSNETDCQKFDVKEGTIDFKNLDGAASGSSGDGSNKTFAPTEYCDPCPDCGVKRKNGGSEKWEAIKEDCSKEKEKNYKEENITEISVLTPEEGKKRILQKYEKFCDRVKDTANGGGQIKEWQCYYEDRNKNNCVEGKWGDLQNGKNHMSYYSFFYGSIIDMLNESMEWKTQVNSCIKKAESKTCTNGCRSKCNCYKRWIDEKKKELKQIKDHFLKQKDMLEDKDHPTDPETTFKLTLSSNFLTDIEEAYGNPQQIGKIKDLFRNKNEEVLEYLLKEETMIEEFLNEEEGEAEKCIANNPEQNCNKKPSTENLARKENFQEPTRKSPAGDDDDSSSEEEEEDDSEVSSHEGDGDEESVTQQEPSGPVGPTVEEKGKPACEIVRDLFSNHDNTFTDACTLKYGHPQRHWGWKCIPTENTNSEATSEKGSQGDKGETGERGSEGEAKRKRREAADPKSGDSNQGGICIPPRRRKLYIGPLKRWAEEATKNTDKSQVEGHTADSEGKGGGTADGVSQPGAGPGVEGSQAEAKSVQAKAGTEATAHSTSNGDQTMSESDKLRNAFIESAAVETFFLWDRYKKIKNQEEEEKRKKQLEENGFSLPFSIPSPTLGAVAALGPRLSPGLNVGYPPGSTGVGLPPKPSVFGTTDDNSSPQPGNLMDEKLGLASDMHRGSRGILTLPTSANSDPNDPETSLQSGTIPAPFLRQMFYTLGDYRDICVGVNEDVNNALEKSVYKESSGGDKSNKDPSNNITMKQLSEKIKKTIQQSGQPPSQTGKPVTTGVTTPSSWWERNAPSIWEAMICALTYKDNSEIEAIGSDGTHKITQNDELKRALWDEDKKQPKKEDYQYSTVTLEDETSGTQPMAYDSSRTLPSNGTTLAEFVTRPAYFRWLEEWGTEFCVKRKSLLKNVRDNCRNSDLKGHEHCSGDGHDCTHPELRHKDMFKDSLCSGCYEHCRKYRKWIDLKFAEYHNQENKYNEEHEKLKKDNNCSGGSGDNTCCDEIKKKSSVDEFLKALKHCKNDQNDGEKGKEEKENEINFDNPLKTFGPLEYCKTCPLNGVTCSRRRSGTNQCTPVNGNGNSWKDVFEGISGNGTKIDVEMIDRRAPFIKNYLNESQKSKESNNSLFNASYLFKGVRVQNWECRYKDEKTDVCKLTNFKDEIDLNDYTTFKVLLIYWLEDFLYGYYLLKKKKLFEQCKEKGEETYSEESKNSCACVKQWVEKKRTEWESIKKHFPEKKKDGSDTVVSRVRNFLEQLIPRMHLTNNKAQNDILDKLEKSLGCNCTKNSEQERGEDYDVVGCLIQKLKDKIDKCPSPSSDTHCSQPQQTVEDDDYENENPIKAPEICNDVLKTSEPEEKDEGGCKATEENVEEKPKAQEESSVPSPPDQESSPSGDQGTTGQSEQTEQTPVLKPEEEAPAPAPAPSTPVAPPQKEETPSPPIQPQPSDNTSDILKTTIPFGIAIALTSFALFFIKKKSKSSIDLLRVMEIPKNDYGIPTKLSPNMYIPYGSGKYRGKRYIYIEGDSGTDSGYTDHYSDITSSSESEYEEFDINDIYPYQSPKYKTLIEVVLEPSKRDIQNDISSGDTPADKFTDNEWNQLKKDFISNMLQNEQPNDLPNDYTSGTTPTNTNNTTMSSHNVDNNTHPTMSHDNVDEKSFIMSIHDRNLYTGEEYNYDMANIVDSPYSGENNLYSGIDSTSDKRGSYSGNHYPYSGTKDPISDNHHPYSGTDLINDSLNSGNHDIYDELLKRKENELFGTNHTKHTTTNIVAKPARDYLIHNQLELFHKWLDRHRNMCEKWENHHERLAKLKEEWENDNNHCGNKHSDIPSNNIHSSDIHPSDIPSGKLSDTPSDKKIHSDIPSSNRTLNTDVSIQIDMDDDPKTTNEFSNMDTTPIKTTMDNINPVDSNTPNPNLVENPTNPNPNHVQIQMSVKNTQMMEEKYPIGDVWDK
ncbi:erythrocyte membrane protein 1, EMP1 [Plasmodium reichenowi]|uniref:Erythrocyte membrane protein 1, EMP1 n=1 Tax=Plasmodium reichenowi TaxID=5854 RepID=A0A060RRE2_PLARE|nr:erythrocyte membrane protein 1, EMP1 [Plasmodium reichenowi]